MDDPMKSPKFETFSYTIKKEKRERKYIKSLSYKEQK